MAAGWAGRECAQMRAVRIFMGLGRVHPVASLQFKMNMQRVKWEAMKLGCRVK